MGVEGKESAGGHFMDLFVRMKEVALTNAALTRWDEGVGDT